MDEFIKKMPKIELHAHLNGSLSEKTILKLIELKRKSQPGYGSSKLPDFSKFVSLSECFDVFTLVHDLVDCVEAVKLATECVIQEFSQENVLYLELRSTPRNTESMTKMEYLQTIIDTIISCKESHPNIIVKYLPSINISYGSIEARTNFELFRGLHKKFPEIIRGLDLSGDPAKGKFAEIRSVFQEARDSGMKLALHCAEVKDAEEIFDMLDFMTSEDRIGHGTFIDESNEQIWSMFQAKNIPVEICLTSNYLCKTASSYEDHHVTRLMQINHPFMICTDDYGVFKTNLTNELMICAKTFKLKENDLVNLTLNANKYSFACESEKQLINEKIEKFREAYKDLL